MMYSSDLMPGLTGIAVELNRTSKEMFRGVDFRGYLQETMTAFRQPRSDTFVPTSVRELPERIFKILTTREYCYLSTDRMAPYQKNICARIAHEVSAQGPIRFFLDLGGGYHTSVNPAEGPLSFEVGLGELFVLYQIRTFVSKVTQLYAPGATFTLVIDNLRAALIDEVPVANTAAYCAKLRELIVETGMSELVELLVESEQFTLADFAGARTTAASDRARLYAEVSKTSEQLLNTKINGIQVTQRASATTICFRPFPGGDSRIQAGEVVLLADASQRVRPTLLTTRNASEYVVQRESPYTFLPRAIKYLTFAKPFLG